MRSQSLLSLFAMLAVAAGCSSTSSTSSPAAADVPAVDPGWKVSAATSGTRLRARFLTAGDAREHVGFYDTLRNEGCTFQRAEGGRMRCLPPTLSYIDGTSVFADTACQTPVRAVVKPGCDEPKYAIVTAYDGTCGQAPFELRRVIGPASPVYANAGRGCAPSQAQYLAIGDVVPWTDFAEGVSTPAPGDGLVETLLVTADGARQHEGFRATNFDADCTFQVMTDGVTRCVPDAISGEVLFSDDACTTPSATFVYSTSPCSRAATNRFLEPDPSNQICGAIRAIYDLLPASAASGNPGDLYVVPMGGTCTFRQSSGGQGDRRDLGANLTPTLPVAARIGGGSGRLVPALVPAAGSVALDLGWHDRDRNVDCGFKLASDGKMRCLPSSAEATIFSIDGACASPSHVAVPSKAACVTTASTFALVPSKVCPVTAQVYALGTERRDLPAASVETAPGTCATVAGVMGGHDATVVDPTQFVEGLPLTE
jgi:hypothetical protein